MWLNFSAIIRKLSLDPDCRAVLITGAGPKALTAGLDVQAASQGIITKEEADVARKARVTREHIIDFQNCITDIERCGKPVVILYHGISYGLGIDMGVACDIRICTKDARMSVKEVDIGLAADIGTLTRLPKSGCSFSWVKDVALTAREFYADEALRVGFVSHVAENKEAGIQKGLEICKLIASKSPVAVYGTKELLNWSRDRPVEDGLKYTAIWNAGMIQTSDVKRAMLSGLQKRKPTFEKL
jgi:delta(3,5)-delta(2,4)-dienoyl-CoA isomerase